MPESAPQTAPQQIRRCTEADIEWMVAIGEERYPGQFDTESVRAWGRERMVNPLMAFFRGERSFGACHLANRFNAPSRKQAYLTLLYSGKDSPSFALSLEPFFISQALIEWARGQGATKFWFSDMTGTDLGPFVKKLGGKLAGHTYVIDLDGKGTPYG